MYSYRIARIEDDATIRKMLAEGDMDSWVSASLEREPSYFAGCNLMGESVAMLAVEDGTPVGLYCCDTMPVYLHGVPVRACYLGGLRVTRKARGRLLLLKGGFGSIPRLVPAVKEAAIVFTSVAEENLTARRLLETNLKGMPEYSFMGEMCMYAVSTRRGKNRGLFERARDTDADELAFFFGSMVSQYDLSPVLTKERLLSERPAHGRLIDSFLVGRKGGKIVSCVAVWDQRHFKQIVIRGYRPVLNRFRKLYNCWATFHGRQELPAVGEQLQQVFLSFIAFDEKTVGGLIALLEEALYVAYEQGAKTALFSLPGLHDGCGAIGRKFGAVVYKTRIEQVSLNDYGKSCSERVSCGTVWPEIALL